MENHNVAYAYRNFLFYYSGLRLPSPYVSINHSLIPTCMIQHRFGMPKAYRKLKNRLSLESKASTNLVASLIQLLGVKGSTNTKGEARVDLCVVCNGDDTSIVNFELDQNVSFFHVVDLNVGLQQTLAKAVGSILYLVATSIPTVDWLLVS
jgi:hypothetical protein